MEKNRNYIFDLVRSVCVIYIVCVWHLNEYLSDAFKFSGVVLDVLHIVTNIVLGTFTFLSGYFLKKYSFSDASDVGHFFKKRLGRFFVLLFLADLTYFILHWLTKVQFIKIICGLDLFIAPSSPTLWFFSMLICFYLLTPLMKFSYKKGMVRICVCVFVFLLFAVLNKYCGADERLLYYFPCYVFGLLLPTEKVNSLLNKKLTSLVCLAICVLAAFLSKVSAVGLYVAIYSGILLLLGICSMLYRTWMNKAIAFIATSSMIAYLFHRQVFAFCREGAMLLFGMDYIPIIAAMAACVLIFIVSYYIQLFYDGCYRKCTRC